MNPAFWRAIFNRRTLICVFTGFASGMPLYVLIQLVPAWLRSEGVGLTEIGFFSLIGLPYTWKFLWSPLLDRYRLTPLGKRRSWMLLTQLALILAIAGLPLLSTETDLLLIAALAALVAVFSATQDIALDAFRREILPDRELGLGNSVHVTAYRISSLVPGSLALILADILPWNQVFPITALFMLVGVLLSLKVSEPTHPQQAPGTLVKASIEPFREFFTRHGARSALLILAFMFFYKLGDSMATALQTPLFLDLGYSLTEVGVVAKHAALWPSIVGGLLGGTLMVKIGINKALWLFGLVQIASILGYALLARIGEGLWLLGIVVSFEYLGVGLGTVAFVAFIARTTSRAFAATQLALFTAFTAMPRTLASAVTGLIVERTGWEVFFYFCTLIAIPGMVLLFWVAPWNDQRTTTDQSATSAPR